MKIVQVMNALDPTDAVTVHLLELDRMLRRIGHETEIYSRYCHPDFEEVRRPSKDLVRARGDLLLFHFAGYTELLGPISRFRGLRGVVYHNVTPSRFFEGMEEARSFCDMGRRQVADLPGVFHFGLGVSEFNRRELEEAGFEKTAVLPISREVAGMAGIDPSPEVLGRLGPEAKHVLMVGRLAPHKGVVEGVRAFARYRERGGGDARLWLVGRTRGYDAYVERVRKTIRELGVERAVTITGEVALPELRAYYERADALLVLSEHEGFCVPLAEAMTFGVPAVAHASGAVPETLGGAGVLLDSRDEETVAGALGRVLEDERFRAGVIEGERRRREAFSPEAVEERLLATLTWAASLREGAGETGPPPSFSIVICTYNRARVLEKCLAALRSLEYPAFEVVVVNGPSTDHTDEVLALFPDVKRADNGTRNLSISRNLGIAAAAGEVIAFIDDDALPDTDWLERLADAYADPEVGAAGGPVIGPGGDHLQFDNGVISRSGMPRAIQEEPAECNDPGGEWFNILMGTNSSFRRSALEAVGGFDENYEYYHDESDLCVRVIRAGYRIVHVPGARVWHEFEKSHIRKTLRDVNWRVVAKNTIYFFFKNNRWWERPFDFFLPLRAVAVLLGSFTRWYVKGEIGRRLFLRSLGRWLSGCFLGYMKGLFRPPRRHLGRRSDPRSATLRPFGRVEIRGVGERLHVALVSQQYPPDLCGGIGVYTEQLARGLAEAGHRVSVIARGNREAAVWRDGVKVYRVPDDGGRVSGLPPSYRVTRKNMARSYAVQGVIGRLRREENLRVVESPLWDAEAFVPAVGGRVPLIIRMNTPMAMAMETQGWRRSDDMALACEMEWETLRRARGWIDTSGSIVDTFAERGWVTPGEIPVQTIPFGVAGAEKDPAKGAGPEVRFLFVGRLEPRKGIDTLLAAIPRVLRECPASEFVIAGEIPEGGRLPARFFRECGVPDAHRRVRFLGRVDDETRDRLYREADVFVAPSRYESFGIVFLEAMAAGTPVVACRSGGAARVVDHGTTGLLAAPGDADALGDALLLLSKDGDLRRRMGGAAIERVRREYTIERMVERTLAFYGEILGLPSAVPSPSGPAPSSRAGTLSGRAGHRPA